VPSASWDVSPAYADGYYLDNATADRSEKPFPPPPATTLPTWRNDYDWDEGHGYAGWHSGSSATHGGTYGVQSAFLGHYGLWLWPAGGTYGNGDYAEWTYTAPGTTRISTAKLWFLYRNKLLSHHCVEVGLRTASGTIVDQNVHCKPTWRPDWQRGGGAFLVDPADNPTATTLYFRIRLNCGRAATCTKTIPARNPYWNGAFARLLEANIKLVDDDQPVVTPSGDLWDLANQYTNGRSAVGLTVDAADAGAGIVRNWVERAGTGVLAVGNAPCDPKHHTDALDSRICPAAYSFSPSIDLNPFPEGTSQFTASSIDPAGNVGSETWPAYVDRTPPSIPGGIRLVSFDGDLATIEWDDSTDPALPDGVAGSGVQQYLVRYQVNGGGFGDWFASDDSSASIGGVAEGDLIDVEVQSVDRVGNTSAAGTASPAVPAATGAAGPVLTGRVSDANGNAISGEIGVYLANDDVPEQTAIAVGSTADDGSFSLQVRSGQAAAVVRTAAENGGWVNFDVIASNGGLTYSGAVSRKINLGVWSDGIGTPAPLNITLASGSPGVFGSPALRSLAGARRAMQLICPVLHYPVATRDEWAVIGELHTGDNQRAVFEYGQKADSDISIGVSEDGTHWTVSGSAHVSTSLANSETWPELSHFGAALETRFRFTKYQYFLGCSPQVKWFKVKVTKWLSSGRVGEDLRRFDNRCTTTYAKYAAQFAPGQHAATHRQRAHTWDAGVTVFGASLDARSGFSKWVSAEWTFGRKNPRYWLCGSDDDFVSASRIFAGAG
jgi:hypothetical protein